jgi:hypothetical protein
VQEELLELNPELQIRVYAVWMPMVPTDRWGRWGARSLTDARVEHSWDEERLVGRFFAGQLRGDTGGVLWDAFLLYSPEAHWDASLDAPHVWGAPIVDERDELAASVGQFRHH